MKLYRIFFLTLVIVNGCTKKSDENTIVAEAGDHKTSVAAFARSYINEIKLSSVEVQDSPALRMKHLNDMITRHFLAQKAKEANLHDLPGFKKVMKAESTAVIIHGLYEKEIASELNEIKEEDLEDAYKKMNMKLHVRHLVSRTKFGIDSLYNHLLNGESFEALAKECFRDSTLMMNGGDLGYVTWGDLDMDFENAAFALEPGEISKPVETKFGWHIIKLEDFVLNPILREHDFQIHKESIRKRLRQRLLKNKADLRVKEMMKKKNVELNVPLITALEKARRRMDRNELIQIADVVEIGDDPLENILEKYKNENIATYDGGVWTVSDFMEYLHTVAPAYIEAGIYRAVAMSLRNYFLLQRAQKKRIGKVESVKNEIDEKREHLLSATYLNIYADTCSFSEDDYLDYYETMKKRKYNDKEMNVLEILVKSKSQAMEIVNKIVDKNKDETVFREMAVKHTIRPGMKEKEGYLGIIRKGDYGEIGRACYALEKGGVTGPIKTDAGYSIVMVIDVKEIFALFEDVKQQVVETMELQKKSILFTRWKREYTTKPEVVIHEDVLFNAF